MAIVFMFMFVIPATGVILLVLAALTNWSLVIGLARKTRNSKRLLTILALGCHCRIVFPAR